MRARITELTVTRASAIALWMTAAALSGVILLAAWVTYSNAQDDAAIEKSRQERISQINRVNAAQCEALRTLYDRIRTVLEEANQQIDRIAYYREHPEEAEQAKERNRRQIALFAEPPCPPDITLEG